jgi:hypothetical protein
MDEVKEKWMEFDAGKLSMEDQVTLKRAEPGLNAGISECDLLPQLCLEYMFLA